MLASRRTLLAEVLPGSVVAVAAVTTIGWVVAPNAADAMPQASPRQTTREAVDDLRTKPKSWLPVRAPSAPMGLLVAPRTSHLRLAVSANGACRDRAIIAACALPEEIQWTLLPLLQRPV